MNQPHLESDELRALPRAFGGPVLRALGEGRIPPILAELLSITSGRFGSRQGYRLRNWYSWIYRYLAHRYQVEYVYKNSLTRDILRRHHAGRPARVYEEFQVGSQVADLLVVNGTSTIYEIKTAYDSLDRLPDQLASYRKLAEYVYVVTAEARAKSVRAALPVGVGLMALTSRAGVYKLLEATSNRDLLSPAIVFDRLRMAEYQDIVRRHCPAGPVVFSSGTSYAEHRPHFCRLPSDVVHSEAVDAWGGRPIPTELVQALRRVPNALVHALLTAGLTRSQAVGLPHVLNLPLKEVA